MARLRITRGVFQYCRPLAVLDTNKDASPIRCISFFNRYIVQLGQVVCWPYIHSKGYKAQDRKQWLYIFFVRTMGWRGLKKWGLFVFLSVSFWRFEIFFKRVVNLRKLNGKRVCCRLEISLSNNSLLPAWITLIQSNVNFVCVFTLGSGTYCWILCVGITYLIPNCLSQFNFIPYPRELLTIR